MVHLLTNVAEYAIIMRGKEFLLVQGGKEFNYTWHFAGGRLNKGDKEVEGLKREVKEELGIELKNIKPVFAKYMEIGYTKDIKISRYALFYLAEIKEGEKITLDKKELYQFGWFTKKDLDKIKFWLPFYKEMLEKVL